MKWEDKMNKDGELLLDFENALGLIKNGVKLSRKSWTEIDFIFLVPGSEFKVNRPPLLGIYSEGTLIKYKPHIDASFKYGTIGTWSPTNLDILAEDWYIF